MAAKLNEMLRALADPTRLRILTLLQGCDELCVCELVEALRLPQYHVSRHLRTLRAAGLVRGWRQGRWMHYCLNPRLAGADRPLVAAACARAAAEATMRADARRLRQCLRPRAGRGGYILRCCVRKESV
ncbi:MAG TPA: metalloregulator ArsR/SmtB family transcription factor [Armatimonadota bacterium]|nr:metalloregulator ArsR/SmtB family transcription factor [Armatimonadota bacterium]